MKSTSFYLRISLIGGSIAAFLSTIHAQGDLDIQSPNEKGNGNGSRVRVDWPGRVDGMEMILDQSKFLGDGPLGWRPLAVFPEETSGFDRSVTFTPLVPQRYFRMREDVPPTELRRSDLDSRMEEISWDFTYRPVQLQTLTDGGATWQSVATPPSIHFESGEFYVVRPKPIEGKTRIYRIRQNAPPSLTVPASATVDVGAQAVIDLLGSETGAILIFPTGS